MRIRLKLGSGPAPRYRPGGSHGLTPVLASLFTPAALMAGVLACWRLGEELSLTAEFAFSSGPFSHWQVWGGLAVALHIAAWRLNRPARRRKHAPSSPAFTGQPSAPSHRSPRAFIP